MVFQTAPPHPASKARCTCIPELLGGAEASQKGFGERMPAKLMLRSATCHQPFMNRMCGEFAILNGHHGGSSAASANTIASGVDTGQAGFVFGAYLDEPFFCFQLQLRGERRLVLADRAHHLICGKKKFGTEEPGVARGALRRRSRRVPCARIPRIPRCHFWNGREPAGSEKKSPRLRA